MTRIKALINAQDVSIARQSIKNMKTVGLLLANKL